MTAVGHRIVRSCQPLRNRHASQLSANFCKTVKANLSHSSLTRTESKFFLKLIFLALLQKICAEYSVMGAVMGSAIFFVCVK